MKWMRRVNAWRVAGVADPGYSCFGEYLRVAHAYRVLGLVERRYKVAEHILPWSLQSFADRGDKDFSPMRCAAVFEQENPLPGAELHFSVHN